MVISRVGQQIVCRVQRLEYLKKIDVVSPKNNQGSIFMLETRY